MANRDKRRGKGGKRESDKEQRRKGKEEKKYKRGKKKRKGESEIEGSELNDICRSSVTVLLLEVV